MQALFFYLSYPFIFFIASLPFPLLYVFSDCCFYLVRLTGYRRKVILRNLRNSFPEKTEPEIRAIANDFYRYLCDLVLETLKTMRMSEPELKKRCTFAKLDWLQALHAEKRSLIVVMGHYGNWEWAGPAFSLSTPYTLLGAYRPLANRFFDRLLFRLRTRFGGHLVPARKILRRMVETRREVTATALLADQTPRRKDAYWMEFLHQETPIFTGPEKLARKFNFPVVFMNIRRRQRGYYDVDAELLFENPAETTEGEITEKFTRRLEAEIRKEPTYWLWSHKRWKHKRIRQESAPQV
jgi:Kdo2-lipid IVA lauroyltransferase/acyltransferase